MDRIYIRDLALRCIIGVFAHERRQKQDVIINVVMESDFSEAARTDRLKYAVDYKRIKTRIVTFVEQSKFQLLETLADRIAKLCMEERRVRRVTVTIDKPGALRFARSVAVEVTRERTPIK